MVLLNVFIKLINPHRKKDLRADVSCVSPSSERIKELCQLWVVSRLGKYRRWGSFGRRGTMAT